MSGGCYVVRTVRDDGYGDEAFGARDRRREDYYCRDEGTGAGLRGTTHWSRRRADVVVRRFVQFRRFRRARAGSGRVPETGSPRSVTGDARSPVRDRG